MSREQNGNSQRPPEFLEYGRNSTGSDIPTGATVYASYEGIGTSTRGRVATLRQFITDDYGTQNVAITQEAIPDNTVGKIVQSGTTEVYVDWIAGELILVGDRLGGQPAEWYCSKCGLGNLIVDRIVSTPDPGEKYICSVRFAPPIITRLYISTSNQYGPFIDGKMVNSDGSTTQGNEIRFWAI